MRLHLSLMYLFSIYVFIEQNVLGKLLHELAARAKKCGWERVKYRDRVRRRMIEVKSWKGSDIWKAGADDSYHSWANAAGRERLG